MFFSPENPILSGKHIILGKTLNPLTPQVFSENKRMGSEGLASFIQSFNKHLWLNSY